VLKTLRPILSIHLTYLLILIKISFLKFEYLLNLSQEKIIIYNIVAQSVGGFSLF